VPALLAEVRRLTAERDRIDTPWALTLEQQLADAEAERETWKVRAEEVMKALEPFIDAIGANSPTVTDADRQQWIDRLQAASCVYCDETIDHVPYCPVALARGMVAGGRTT